MYTYTYTNQQKLLAIAQPAAGGAPAAAFQPRDGLDAAGRQQLERLIGEHLLRQGYFGALACLEAEQAEQAEQAQAQQAAPNPTTDPAAGSGLFDLDVFTRIQQVAAGLRDPSSRDCSPALAWCADHGSKLRRLGSLLEFRLHKQHFLELVRRGERVPALAYAGQHLSPAALLAGAGAAAGADSQGHGSEQEERARQLQQEVQQAMATLALEDPAGCPVLEYARLFAPERWAELGDLFAAEARRCYGLGGGVGTLEVVLQAGLTALRTPICARMGEGGGSSGRSGGRKGRKRGRGRRAMGAGTAAATAAEGEGDNDEDEDEDDAMETDDVDGAEMAAGAGASNCPVCHPAGRVLAAGLPFAHFNNSYLTCALTGARMDHENPPVALPNGRVYSRRAVQELLTVQGSAAEEGEDGARGGQGPRVRCPRTGETFPLSQARTIFII